MKRSVGVCLDGKARPLDVERREQLALALVAIPAGNHLLHPPEDDPAVLALQLDRDDPEPRLESHGVSIQRLAGDERATEHRMPGERQLLAWREDPNPDISVLLWRQDEDRLREVQLARQALHPLR